MTVNSMREWFNSKGLSPHPADALIEASAADIRRTRPGRFTPAIEYDWAQDAWRTGAKDHRGNWAVSSMISAPIGSGGLTLEWFALSLDDLAALIRRKAQKEQGK